jgi:hypothetical protein
MLHFLKDSEDESKQRRISTALMLQAPAIKTEKRELVNP